jgi:putative ABC transport system permease protein
MLSLKVFIRFLWKNKVLTLINIGGLSIGIASCLFINLFVTDELSYDLHERNIDRIYRIVTKIVSEGSVDRIAITASALADHIEQNYPEVDKVIRFSVMGNDVNVKRGDALYKEKRIIKADADVFDVFSYKITKGDPSSALKHPYQVVLTESSAKKYFGSTDPLGQELTIFDKDHTVSAVMKDPPPNSDLWFTMLTSMDSTNRPDDWFDFDYRVYVMFGENSITSASVVPAFEKKINEIIEEKVNRYLRENKHVLTFSLQVQPLRGLHFQEPLQYDTPKGNKSYVYIFSCVAILILFIGCLNYINFSILQSIERGKEVGIHKVIGARFSQLVARYLTESFLLSAMSVVFAIVIAMSLMPVFNGVVERQFAINDLFTVRSIFVIVAILVIVGLIAGSYSSFYTSSIKPVLALKGNIASPRGQWIRKISVAVQFFISIGLVICTFVIYNQMVFVRDYDLGFQKDNILVLEPPNDSTMYERSLAFKKNLTSHSTIKNVSASGPGSLLGNDDTRRGSINVITDGKQEARMVNYTNIDEDYFSTLGIRILEGKNFDANPNSNANAIIVNEAMVRMMGWKNPLEQKISWVEGKLVDIIGVVRDFNYASLYNKVEPQVIVPNKNQIFYVYVSLSNAQLTDGLAFIKSEWEKAFPDEPFAYKFLDESLAAQYVKEEKAMSVFTYFSILTIVISCLGLFGLSSLAVYQRRREVGIRQVVGADFRSILTLFAREYVVLIAASTILVSPLVWFGMEKWLQTFPYRDKLSFMLFILIGACVLIVSIITVALSILKISRVKAVRLIAEQ